MKKLIILIEILILAILLYLTFTVSQVMAEVEEKYYIMNITFYSLDKTCISDKWNDGNTATMTKIRPGVCAINVDFINGKWIVKSPLKLGDKIYIEGLGEYLVEDTGRFGEKNAQQDIYTVDVFEPDHNKAILSGKQLRKVFIIE